MKISFVGMTPIVHPGFDGNKLSLEPFVNVYDNFRALEWKNNEYVLATNKKWDNILVKLPKGVWHIKQYDVVRMLERVINSHTEGNVTIQVPDFRACFFHFKKIIKT